MAQGRGRPRSGACSQCEGTQQMRRKHKSAVEIAERKPTRAQQHAPEPFERNSANPDRRAALRARKEVETRADREEAQLRVPEAPEGGKLLLLGSSKRHQNKANTGPG